MAEFDFQALPGGSVTLHDARRARNWSVELKPFEIAAFPVSEKQYAELHGETARNQGPATNLSWLDAVHFCNAVSAINGLNPAYEFHDAGVIWRTDAVGYRLPTEAEWEYACRAGSTGPHYGPLDQVAWTSNDAVTTPQPSGAKSPNAFGLYDTLGNVWEWCWDYLDPARYRDYRVFRGGGFADKAWSVRASARRGGGPGMSHPDLGFRIVRGGFTSKGQGMVQGWSAAADAARSSLAAPLPSGWTPQH